MLDFANLMGFSVTEKKASRYQKKYFPLKKYYFMLLSKSKANVR